MTSNIHDRIEAIAGAIALGEATDEERREYREHISSCARCLDALGGEREIERVASRVAEARESEVWEPELRAVAKRANGRVIRRIGFAGAFIALVLTGSIGVASMLTRGSAHSSIAVSHADRVPSVRIVVPNIIIAAATPAPPTPAPPPARRLIIEHNVVQMSRAPVADPQPAPVSRTAPHPRSTPSQIAEVVVHPDTPPVQNSNVPIWRRGDDSWRTIARTTTTSLTETAPQTLAHNAESMQVSPRYTRDAALVGGPTAINPQPPMIAYDEGAQGTSVFEVLVDERGNPVKCVITKSAGYAVLDEAVCKAAMQAHYTPKMVDGRAVPGSYHDAFTFRMDDNQSIEGIPHPATDWNLQRHP